MQTFLPYADFTRSAKVLDPRRLGKQRLEAIFVLQRLTGVTEGPGWRNHPIMAMWRGSEDALAKYGLTVCQEWVRRGYVDTLTPRFEALLARPRGWKRPPWLGLEPLHASHRSNLLRKDLSWYAQFGWREPPDLPYLWPRVVDGSVELVVGTVPARPRP